MTPAQIDFATFCIGNLATKLNMPQKEVYRRLKVSGILNGYIIKGYDILHTFSKEYLMEDLIGYMKEKKPCNDNIPHITFHSRKA